MKENHKTTVQDLEYSLKSFKEENIKQEQIIDQLSTENTTLEGKNSVLTKENQALKSEIQKQKDELQTKEATIKNQADESNKTSLFKITKSNEKEQKL